MAAGVAIVLPWSTSLTVVFVWLYLASLLPVLRLPKLRDAFLEPLSAVPTLLFLLAAVGMMWADVSWGERLKGLSAYRFMLFIPALILHFRISAHAHWVLGGFLLSCSVLLLISWAIYLFPAIPWQRPVHSPDVPIKDHITQGVEFTFCIFALAGLAGWAWQKRQRWACTASILLMLAFAGNILYVAPSRTVLIVLPIVILLLAWRQFGWRGLTGAVLTTIVVAALVWASSPTVRNAIGRAVSDVEIYPHNFKTPVGFRLEFWRKSLNFVLEAPLIGHGTGGIEDRFSRDAESGTAGITTTNPHNQVLAVALQLGFIGVAILLAMWFVHAAVFWSASGLAPWIGIATVAQFIISSLFNSVFFDFTPAVGYALAIGVAGAVVLQNRGREIRSGGGASPAGSSCAGSTSKS
jgi:O-antigen ligase